MDSSSSSSSEGVVALKRKADGLDMTPRKRTVIELSSDDDDDDDQSSDDEVVAAILSSSTRQVRTTPATTRSSPIKYTYGSASKSKADMAPKRDLRRDVFLQKNAAAFLAVLPERNHVANLMHQQHRENGEPAQTVPWTTLSQPKTIVGGEMKSYQLQGLSFLNHLYQNGMNGILADEMGLGKTLQTLSLLAHIHETEGVKGPHLIVCPLSVLNSWMTEAKRWLPSFSTVRFHGSAVERTRLKTQEMVGSSMADLVVATYESYVAEQGYMKSKYWRVVVLDEGHKIKNSASQVSASFHGLGGTRNSFKLILTGTPVQNNLTELWSLLYFLLPTVFIDTTRRKFEQAFDLTSGKYDTAFLSATKGLLELIMLRRTKEGVKSQLSVPPREELSIYVPLSPAQRFWYTRLLQRMDSVVLADILEAPPAAISVDDDEDDDPDGDKGVQAMIDQAVRSNRDAKKGGDGQDWKKLQNLLMQLRKVTDHPYMLPNAESEPFEIAEHLVAASAKIIALDKLLKDVLPKGQKVIIFSGFTKMLDILQDFMELRDYRFARLDGSTSRPRRTLAMKLFQQQDGDQARATSVFLISTRAGGLGVNLTAATVVVLFDSDWNPTVDIQAIARAHRIGQTKKVTVYRFVCGDTCEEQMQIRLRKKLYLSTKIMGESGEASGGEAAETEDGMPRMTYSDLTALLRGGLGAVSRWTGEGDEDPFVSFRAASWEQIRAMGERKDEAANALIRVELEGAASLDQAAQELAAKKLEDDERAFLAGKTAVQTRLFEGKMVSKNNADLRNEWKQVEKRARQERTVVIDGHHILSETLNNGQWEAVRTITSNPAALAKLKNNKRKKAPLNHQSHCVVCTDGGTLYECAHCPRVCHAECAGIDAKVLDKMTSFACLQHRCTECARTTAMAGGLLFKCYSCFQSYCEDCLPEEDLKWIGDTHPEFVALGYGVKSHSTYIQCSTCIVEMEVDPQFRQFILSEWTQHVKTAEAMGYTNMFGPVP